MAKIRITITPDNEVAIAVLDGTFAEASEEIRKLVARLGPDVRLAAEGPIEQHRHDPEEEVKPHVHSHS